MVTPIIVSSGTLWCIYGYIAIAMLVWCILLPRIKNRRKLIAFAAKLPGTPTGSAHMYKWLADIGTILSQPIVPGSDGIRDTLPLFSKMCREYGRFGLFRIWAFNPHRLPFLARPMVFVFDPDMVQEILGPKGYGLYSKGTATARASPLVGDSFLSLTDGEEWKHQRKQSLPGFGQAVLELATEVVARLLTENVFPQWDEEQKRVTTSSEGGSVNVTTWMKRLILDVLGEIAFSYSFGGTRPKTLDQHCAKEKDLYDAFCIISSTLSKRPRRLAFTDILPTSENRRFRSAMSQLNETIGKVVTRRTEQERDAKQLESASTTRAKTRKDLLSQLVQKDDDGTRLPHKYVLGNIRMFLFAGHDTTSSTVSFALWHLARNPSVQKRLLQELSSLFQQKNSKEHPTHAELRQLPFLDAVVKETLRLNPPGGMARQALQDVTIGSHVLPAGTDIYIFPWLIHRHELYWEMPNDFIPARFLQEGIAALPLPRPYIPFSVGPRSCIGNQLALAEIRAVLAHVVYKYNILPCYDKHAKTEKEPLAYLTLTINPSQFNLHFENRVIIRDGCLPLYS